MDGSIQEKFEARLDVLVVGQAFSCLALSPTAFSPPPAADRWAALVSERTSLVSKQMMTYYGSTLRGHNCPECAGYIQVLAGSFIIRRVSSKRRPESSPHRSRNNLQLKPVLRV